MKTHFFQETFSELSGFRAYSEFLKKGISPISISGLSHIHKAQFFLSLPKGTRPLIITEDESAALRLTKDINRMAGEELAVSYPSREFSFTGAEGISREYEFLRVSALSKYLSGEASILVASAEASLQITTPPEILKQATFHLQRDEDYDLFEICKLLLLSGYTHCDLVEGPSQFSHRGDILDIFPTSYDRPVRIEFFGDTIDQISYFDEVTQRRVDEPLDALVLTPSRETIFQKDKLSTILKDFVEKLRGKHAAEVKKNILQDVEMLEQGIVPNSIDRYLPLMYEKPATLLDYATGSVFISEFGGCKERMQNVFSHYLEDCHVLAEQNILVKGLEGYYQEPLAWLERLQTRQFNCIHTFMQGNDSVAYRENISFDAKTLGLWSGELATLEEDLRHYLKKKCRILIAAGTEKTAPQIRNDLQEDGFSCLMWNEVKDYKKSQIIIIPGSYSSGAFYPENRTVFITRGKTESTSRKIKRKKKKTGAEIRAISEMSPGDLVVHENYGIGRFMEIKQMEFDGNIKDYVTIAYAGTDVLYVPVTQLDLISRFVGAKEDGAVKLNRLSSSEWKNTKNRVRKAVKDMAKELTALYAKREKAEGFAFYPDDEIQKEFEERFPYVETEDQLRSIEEIKADMELPRPMDRLLCGDVGFGKTEVALRAALKCILSGKQCVLLAPTTVLAWQHYQTAIRRFDQIAVNIEILSRYRTAKQQKEILENLKKGKIDLIIGTHRLLSKDVAFNALGLVIIDEEQRFGVAHKEKFKEKFVGVDILTLSATPIPRTLNMAMSGIRDMSVLEEPPQDRYPVQSYVVEYTDGLVQQAILRELRRGGQVFYLHNRTSNIEDVAAHLQKLVPNARIAYAHGKMQEEEMSEIWRQMVDYEIDILVCTTIIETGVDVPNCNTIIIENADFLGLSQLYQLRGRVGRSNRRAYAYFTFRKDKSISEIAARRLSAMKEFTQFGSGFRIAMRDLEIRGAGSILGGSQHGHLEAVGYDMYIKLLNEAVAEEKGEKIYNYAECAVDLSMDAHIPDTYISSLPQRLEVYRRISMIADKDAYFDMMDELIDRFGDPPKSVEGLLKIALLRNSAGRLGITDIKQVKGQINFFVENLSDVQIQNVMKVYDGRYRFNCNARSYISVKLRKGEDNLDAMQEMIDTLNQKKTL